MEIFIKTDSELMVDKQYEPIFYALAREVSFTITKEGMRVPKSDLKKIVNDYCGYTYTKFTSCLNCFIVNDLVEENDGVLLFKPVTGDFVHLDVNFAWLAAKDLTPLQFKIYVYLLRRYEINTHYKNYKYFAFSKTSILKALGYSASTANVKSMKENLDFLESLGLITYRKKMHGDSFGKGKYHDLLFVKTKIADLDLDQFETLEDAKKWIIKIIAEVPQVKDYL